MVVTAETTKTHSAKARLTVSGSRAMTVVSALAARSDLRIFVSNPARLE